MKDTKSRFLALLLVLTLLAACLPVQALAADAEEAGWFYLTADWNGALLIAPERVSYTAGQSIYEAICAAGHTLSPSAESVTQIDGKAGNFIRSDENGSYDLTRNAAEAAIRYVCFADNSSGSRTAQPSVFQQELIKEMAEYLQARADIQAAARAKYEEAYSGYCAVDDAGAQQLYQALAGAISRYEQTLQGQKFRVSFTDSNGIWTAGSPLKAENQYGLVYADDDGDGALELPAGSYTFTLETEENGAATGGITGQITVTGAMQVTVALERENWLLTDKLELSSRAGTDFNNNRFSVSAVSGRGLEAVVEDSYAGTLYAYWPYNTSGALPSLSAIYTPAGSTEAVSVQQSLISRKSGIDGALAAGAGENTVIYRASKNTAQGYTEYQDYTLVLRRAPTLKEVRVTDASGSPAALEGYDAGTRTYTYLVVGSTATLRLTPSVTEGCSIFVNGKDVTDAGGCTVSAGQTHSVELRAGSGSTRYQLVLKQAQGCTVRIPVDSEDMTLRVCDENGQEAAGSFNKAALTYVYTLIPGRSYTYTATKDRFYHAAGSFTAQNMTLNRVSVQTGAWLTELALAKTGSTDSRGSISLDQPFQPEQHSYTATAPDTPPAVYLWINGTIEDARRSFSVLYQTISTTGVQDDQEKVLTIEPAKLGTAVFLPELLLNQNGRGNTLTIRCSQSGTGVNGSVTYYQDYEITLRRTLSLRSLAVYCGGQEQVLTHSGGVSGYTPSVWSYVVTVPAAAESLSVSAEIYEEGSYRDLGRSGYQVFLGEQELTPGVQATAALNGTSEPETVTLTVTNEFAEGVESRYEILVQKAEPVSLRAELKPDGALLFVREDLSGRRVWPDADGVYALSEGFSYSYLLTCVGYVGKQGSIGTAHTDAGALVVRIDGTDYAVSDGMAEAGMTLQKAEKNEELKLLPAQWADFRGTTYDETGTAGGSAGSNNTVLEAKTPVVADEATLFWANKLGDGFDSGATGCPLLVDGVLITYAGSTIYRVDPVSGEVLAKGQMERASSFAITPPAYAKGMIFVGLSDGTIQAFNAETLESLWGYHDPLKGQPNCPITICGDYLYTGFWRGEEFTANFVCLSITDEDPSDSKEEKTASWYWTRKGGYYWAGAYACDEYVLVGADDGVDGYRSETGVLLLFDAKSGALLDQWDGLLGDVRSTVCYDEATNYFYFTTKGGTFCGVQTEKTSDGWRLKEGSQWTLKLENGSASEPAMSTSTPAVYNGRAYIGVSGSSQFGAYSGHSITVVDLASRRIAYRVDTLGYPQTSGILTTAYEKDTGYVYVYFFDNYTPGKLRVLRDSAGQTSADYLTVEAGLDTPYVLFTPSGSEAQYAICTPVVDEYGVMYFKNDSARMMSFGPAVKELEITQQPKKTDYRAGETFDPEGMKVELVYVNGTRRDVTDYVTWPDKALTEADKSITIRFPYVKYHDAEGGGTHEVNVTTETPYTTLALTVRPEGQEGTISELAWSYSAGSGRLSVTGTFGERALLAACYDQNGRMTQLQRLKAAGELTLRQDSATIKLFLLDANGKPLCQAVSITE